ncbi:MAG: hypothetical protein HYY76_10920 [Acidobacteria bacterium]|nr:hypothetical protein [Acidobacteriota bacterium]
MSRPCGSAAAGRTDQCGHLELTSERLRFHGALDVSVAWSEVAAVERVSPELVVSLATSPRVLRFSCYAAPEAARGLLIVRRLVDASHGPDEQAPSSTSLSRTSP